MPTTATRSPPSSCPWFHWAEWKTVPLKRSRPSIAGNDGSLSSPGAAIITRALITPSEVSIRHSWSCSTHSASSSSQRRRMRGITPNRSAHDSRYSRI